MIERTAFTTEPLRPTVVPVVIFAPGENYDAAKILLVNQDYPDECPNRWRLPQGGIHITRRFTGAPRPETLHLAARREVSEEVGLHIGKHLLFKSAITTPNFWVGESELGKPTKVYKPHGLLVHGRINKGIAPKPMANQLESVRGAKWAPLSSIECALGSLQGSSRERTLSMIDDIVGHACMFGGLSRSSL